MHEARLDALGKRAVRDGVMHQSPRQVKLRTDERAQLMTSVVRTLRDPDLLAKSDQQRVDAGRVDVGQFGEIAHAHHHGNCRKAFPDREITAER